MLFAVIAKSINDIGKRKIDVDVCIIAYEMEIYFIFNKYIV